MSHQHSLFHSHDPELRKRAQAIADADETLAKLQKDIREAKRMRRQLKADIAALKGARDQLQRQSCGGVVSEARALEGSECLRLP